MTKKGAPSSQIIDQMFLHRIVVLYGGLTKELVENVSKQIINLQIKSSEPIRLIIDSHGGALEPTLQLCDLITHFIEAPVTGIVYGTCRSAATFILLSCTERLSTPNSKFLIHSGTRHDISIKMDGSLSTDIRNLQKDIKKTENRLVDIYVKQLTPKAWNPKIKQPEREKFVRKLMKKGDQNFDCLLSAEEALEVGLISKIVDGKLKIF